MMAFDGAIIHEQSRLLTLRIIQSNKRRVTFDQKPLFWTDSNEGGESLTQLA